MWSVWFIIIRKLTSYPMVLPWNSSFASVQDNYFNFRRQSSVLRWIDTPSTRRKNVKGCHPFIKYSHSFDHGPRSNITLFLIPLMLNFLSATVKSFLSLVACNFQKRSTNILWRSKWSVFVAWRLRGPESSIHIKLFYVNMGVLGLDKNYPRHNWIVR